MKKKIIKILELNSIKFINTPYDYNVVYNCSFEKVADEVLKELNKINK